MAPPSSNVPIVSEATRSRVQSILGAFTPPADPGGFARGERRAIRLSIPAETVPVPGMVLFVLVRVMGFPVLGRGEKLAWETTFSYGGIDCAISLEKFGLRFYVDAAVPEDEAEAKLVELLAKLNEANSVLERDVLEPFSAEQIAQGHVTVVNQFQRLRSMYEHYRELAEQAPEPEEAPLPESEDAITYLNAISDRLNEALWRRQERFYHVLSAVNAYFSTLEHALVLSLPFRNFEPTKDSLTEFIVSKKWRDKFKRIYDLAGDPEAHRLYGGLSDVAERYRNTFAHGAFGRQGGTLYFHVPGIGALPALLTRVAEAPHYQFPGFGEQPLDDSPFELFDKVDKWMREGPTREAFAFIESGLDLAFDAKTIGDLNKAIETGTFSEYLDAQAYWDMIATNMDW